MVAVALPKLARSFGIGRGHAGLLITVYLVAMLIGQPLSGRLSDKVGNKRLTMISLLGFALCSVAAALSPTFRWLVVARGLQALFASALAPSVQSMLRSITRPEQRGHAFGILGSVIGVGAAAGPIFGGALVSAFGWKAIFVANVPIAAVALAVLIRVSIPAHAQSNTEPSSSTIVRTPTKNLRAGFVAAFCTQALANLGQYSFLLIAPIVLDHRGWSSGTTGLALSSLTIGLIVMGPPGGRFGDRHGKKRAIGLGLMVAAIGTLVLVPFGVDVAPVVLILALALFGVGLGFASPSMISAGLETVPPERTGVAAGVLSASRYVGSIVASVVLAAVVADDGSGARVMYVIAAAAVVLAVPVARHMPTSIPQRGGGEASAR
jgi:MFS transporter, DHA2 family, methylenomycin A resistance protein